MNANLHGQKTNEHMSHLGLPAQCKGASTGEVSAHSSQVAEACLQHADKPVQGVEANQQLLGGPCCAVPLKNPCIQVLSHLAPHTDELLKHCAHQSQAQPAQCRHALTPFRSRVSLDTSQSAVVRAADFTHAARIACVACGSLQRCTVRSCTSRNVCKDCVGSRCKQIIGALAVTLLPSPLAIDVTPSVGCQRRDRVFTAWHSLWPQGDEHIKVDHRRSEEGLADGWWLMLALIHVLLRMQASADESTSQSGNSHCSLLNLQTSLDGWIDAGLIVRTSSKWFNAMPSICSDSQT